MATTKYHREIMHNSSRIQTPCNGQGSLILQPAKSLTLWTIILLFNLYGCVDIVFDIEFPETEPKIVVHSFISPADTAVQVLLSWSNPININIPTAPIRDQEFIRYIDNATVRISEKGQPGMVVPFYPNKNVYALSTSAFPISVGKEYTLTVELDGYEPVSGSCRVPPANNTLQLEKLDFEDMGWSELIYLEYSFTDIPGQTENFYTPGAYLDALMYVYDEDTLMTGKRRFETLSGENHLSNKGREGRRFLIRAEAYNNRLDWMEAPPENDADSSNIYLLLLTTDMHYHHYHRSLESYVPDNPFAEPVAVYSNITGGLGVFAGYNRFEIEIRNSDL